MIVPLSVLTIGGELLEKHPAFADLANNEFVWGQTDIRPFLLMIVIHIALSLIIVWGIACVLVVGKRMIMSKAGRARTSFSVVRKEGGKYVVNLFLTGVLRDIFSFFWVLLLIIPGIIYSLRTVFYHIVIVCEDTGYRPALLRSKEIVKGHTWTVLWYFLGLSLVIFLPIVFVMGITGDLVSQFDTRLLPAVYIMTSVLMALGMTLMTLSTILLFAEIKKLPA